MLHAQDMKIMLIEVSNTSWMFNKIMENTRMLSLGSTTIHPGFHKMGLHGYVNNLTALIRPKDVMMYARGINHK